MQTARPAGNLKPELRPVLMPRLYEECPVRL